VTPAEADRFVGAAAAYVHIPFCSAVCPYCDFAVVAGEDHLEDRYIAAVCAEITSSEEWKPLDAVYFGGGTPTHVAPGLLGKVLDTLSAKHGIRTDAEISVEANPEDFTITRAKELMKLGFNRASFGAQSFDSAVLSSLGRRHEAPQIEESVAHAREAGFKNLSIDLIYGIPGESDDSWKETLRRATGAGPDHVSCYALTVERGTPLSRSVRDGAQAPDPDVQADRYRVADEWLVGLGYHRYEVSNWARSGQECRYNLTCWAQGEYEAYGNGAHGFRKGRRFRNHRRVDAYIERIETGRSPRAGEDRVDGWEAELDRLFVGLRRRVGAATGPGTEALLRSDEGRALLDAGVITEENDRLVVTKPLLTDEVHRSVLSQVGPIVRGDGDA